VVLDRKYHTHWLIALNTGFMAELEYEKTAQEIAKEIVSHFPPNYGKCHCIFSSDLRRLIVKVIDADRQRVKEWLKSNE
jgi:hypothetical protein